MRVRATSRTPLRDEDTSTDNDSEEEVITYRREGHRTKKREFYSVNETTGGSAQEKKYRAVYSFDGGRLLERYTEYDEAFDAFMRELQNTMENLSNITDNDMVLTSKIKEALNASLKEGIISQEEINSPPHDLFELIPGLVLAYQIKQNLLSETSFKTIDFNRFEKSTFQLHHLQEGSEKYDTSDQDVEKIKAIFETLTHLNTKEETWLLKLNQKLCHLNREDDKKYLQKMKEPYDTELEKLGKIIRKISLQSFFGQRKTWTNSLAKVFSELQITANEDNTAATSNP